MPAFGPAPRAGEHAKKARATRAPDLPAALSSVPAPAGVLNQAGPAFRIPTPADSDQPIQRKVKIKADEGAGTYYSAAEMQNALGTQLAEKYEQYTGQTVPARTPDAAANSVNLYSFDTIWSLVEYMSDPNVVVTPELQLQPEDLIKTGPMPTKYEESKGCVAQAITQVKGGTPQSWHDYFIKQKKVDYTEAMNHLLVFGDEKVGMSLIHNENTTWDQVDPNLSNGTYIFINMSAPGKDGHAFAAERTGLGQYVVKDVPQKRIKKYEPKLRIQYVFQ
ncbi:MAG TPA: hypothetical protein VNT26_05345 [Candidatus Sulfotelmatobacter sp.]|nr:hypothetical protein [Candidatus Sulfotelmatobacter sp.]